MSVRIEKVNSEIKRRIVEIIRKEIDDPRLGIVSITRVNTTADLKKSRIFFSALNNNFSQIAQILNHMSSFLRVNLARSLRIKNIPELMFIPDDSIRYSVNIYNKIEEIKNAEKNIQDNTR